MNEGERKRKGEGEMNDERERGRDGRKMDRQKISQ